MQARAYACAVAGMKENWRPFDCRSSQFVGLGIVGRRSQFHLHERLENFPVQPHVRPIVPVFQNISVCFSSGRLLHTSARSDVASASRPALPLHFSVAGRAGLPTRGL